MLMSVGILLAVTLIAYVLGSVPSGYVLVRLLTGKDVRAVGSGRTGGTNAMRAAGYGVGLATAVLDMLKGSAGVLLAQAVLLPALAPVGMMLAGWAAILGHNYSVFLKFKGGAGGAPCVGAALAMWPATVLFVVPVGLVVFFGIGYASLTTLSAGLVITILFACCAYFLNTPLEFVVYGVGAFALLAWALRPNIDRLLRGEERVVGLRAKRAQNQTIQTDG